MQPLAMIITKIIKIKCKRCHPVLIIFLFQSRRKTVLPDSQKSADEHEQEAEMGLFALYKWPLRET